MAEVAAGLYAAETAVEGAVIGAIAVSKSTAPLHLTFRKITTPAEKQRFGRSGHTLNVVKGRAYIIGGDLNSSNILRLTLPAAVSTGGQGVS